MIQSIKHSTPVIKGITLINVKLYRLLRAKRKEIDK